jgi:hypothetical protein
MTFQCYYVYMWVRNWVERLGSTLVREHNRKKVLEPSDKPQRLCGWRAGWHATVRRHETWEQGKSYSERAWDLGTGWQTTVRGHETWEQGTSHSERAWVLGAGYKTQWKGMRLRSRVQATVRGHGIWEQGDKPQLRLWRSDRPQTEGVGLCSKGTSRSGRAWDQRAGWKELLHYDNRINMCARVRARTCVCVCVCVCVWWT